MSESAYLPETRPVIDEARTEAVRRWPVRMLGSRSRAASFIRQQRRRDFLAGVEWLSAAVLLVVRERDEARATLAEVRALARCEHRWGIEECAAYRKPPCLGCRIRAVAGEGD